MGGIGSGVRGPHWWCPPAKLTAEACWRISSSDWQRAGCFKVRCKVGPGIAPGGTPAQLRYSLVEGGVELAHGPLSGYLVPIDAVPAYLGGDAIYFRCPLGGCGRRCRKLYLPPGRAIFACWNCHNLTWQSRRDSRKEAAIYRRLGQIVPGDPDLVEVLKEWSR